MSNSNYIHTRNKNHMTFIVYHLYISQNDREEKMIKRYENSYK